MNTFWTIFIVVLTVGNIVGAVWLLQACSKGVPKPQGTAETTPHTWDGDLQEYNNPLPFWWLGLFWLSAVFCAVYLALYPGLGSFGGLLGWSQEDQYQEEVRSAEDRLAPVFARFADIPLAELGGNPEAVRIGRNLFLNNCATCHGSDARGARGFPNLADDIWLYGGDAETLRQTIAHGRQGIMPAMGAALGEKGLDEVVAYVLSLSGRGSGDAAMLAAGQQKFTMLCAACHGPTGQGTPALGAPNLTDDEWLHGPNELTIRDVITNGRTNTMPAQSPRLSEERIRALVAYLLSLRQPRTD
jgi:cytochrome c oxidase cbb3-type subunit 3